MRNISIPLRVYVTLAIVLGTALLQQQAWLWLGIYGAIAISWAIILRTSGQKLAQLLGIELIFLSLIALPLGWQKASFLLIRSLICLLAMNSLILSLPKPDFPIAIKALPLPQGLREIALLAGNYLILLGAEVTRMQRAAQCRGLAGNTTWLRYANTALIGALYLRSLQRSDRVYNAMVIRGYQGEMPVDVNLTPQEIYSLWLVILTAISLTLASYWK